MCLSLAAGVGGSPLTHISILFEKDTAQVDSSCTSQAFQL